ncbi:MAG: hypothetical protein WCP52_05605 [Bacteroidota bacterium]
MDEGKYLKGKFDELKKKKLFSEHEFIRQIGTSRSVLYKLFHQETLKEPYRSNVEKYFNIVFPEPTITDDKEFEAEMQGITIRKQALEIYRLQEELKIANDKLMIYEKKEQKNRSNE